MVTFLIWMFIKYVLRMKLRFSDAELEIGDVAVHGEEAYPQEEIFTTKLSVTAEAEASPSTEEPVSIEGVILRVSRYVAAVARAGRGPPRR